MATLFGVSMFSPRLVRPLASLIGWPLERLRGLTGRLARENAVRKPGRTAVTAGALMIGLAVVVFVTVFAAGISASIGNAIDRNFQGDIVLQNVDGFSPISSGAGREAEQVQGVKTVSSLSFAGAEYKGKDIRVSAVDPATVNDVLSLDWKQGSPSHAVVAVRRRRGARRRLGEEQRHRRGRPDHGAHAARARRDADGRGHGQGQRRPARQPGRDRGARCAASSARASRA